MTIRIIIFLAIISAIDLYVFQAVRVSVRNLSPLWGKTIYLIFWGFYGFICLSFLVGLFYDYRNWPYLIRTYVFALFVIVYFSKLLVVIFLLMDDLFRLSSFLFGLIREHFNGTPLSEMGFSRNRFLVKLGLVAAAVPFFTLIYGMLGNAYRFKVRNRKLNFPNLPDSFSGMRLLQISDFHVGSFSSVEKMKHAVDLILEQKADLIVFTGDLVNDVSEEVDPFKNELKRIQAPMGVYSILGNHDYGDYVSWPSASAKTANLDRLKNLQKEFSWNLLLNENIVIEKEGSKINLIGVENWGAAHNFARYGDMQKATSGAKKDLFTILLSHDPSHWDAEVRKLFPWISFTLSGHTHGMQFGIEIPGFRWSPVKYFYKQWADLYREEGQTLYVNRGIGFIGYPGRVGILPEIAVFELGRG